MQWKFHNYNGMFQSEKKCSNYHTPPLFLVIYNLKASGGIIRNNFCQNYCFQKYSSKVFFFAFLRPTIIYSKKFIYFETLQPINSKLL